MGRATRRGGTGLDAVRTGQKRALQPVEFGDLGSPVGRTTRRGGRGLDQRHRGQLARNTLAARTGQNRALQQMEFGDLRTTRRARGSVQDTVRNPPANRKHRSAKPERTVGAAQRPPRLPPAVGRRKKAQLPRAEPVHRYTEEPPRVPERR